ncbi:MAG: histidinol-phosphatase HisJ family protein, partial [Oscillospiraceae bacterium]|nr:histidinol-phosphatase HisJ family protein [Oscillospiraceae bacterium]
MTDYHVHTTYCDGTDVAEKTVLRAIEMGLTTLGFSGHSYHIYDGRYCMSREDIPAYRAEIHTLREKYKDKIEILCGIEQDLISGKPDEGYDYVIGSVHHIVCDGESVPVDNTPELLLAGVEKYFGGDLYAYCERFFSDVAKMGRIIRPDIIGHFDLVSKFFEKKIALDEKHPRYVAAYTAAIEELVSLGVPFEINTGAISRGWRTTL